MSEDDDCLGRTALPSLRVMHGWIDVVEFHLLIGISSVYLLSNIGGEEKIKEREQNKGYKEN